MPPLTTLINRTDNSAECPGKIAPIIVNRRKLVRIILSVLYFENRLVASECVKVIKSCVSSVVIRSTSAATVRRQLAAQKLHKLLIEQRIN